MTDYSRELVFKTARSGGKGGQNVNKTETMVMGFWDIAASQLLREEDKEKLMHKLQHRINQQGQLIVKCQVHRSQHSNKEEVTRKINELVRKALQPKKARIATQPGKQSRERRLESKRLQSVKKQARQKNFRTE